MFNNRSASPIVSAVADTLLSCISRRVISPAWDQLEALTHDSCDEKTIRELFVTATRRLGASAMSFTEDELGELKRFGVDWPLSETLDELGRITMLISATEHLSDDNFQTLLLGCYDQGDFRERQAVMRALSLLPKAERLISLAIEACRSHIQPIFEAVACENPYPAAYFPELNFNQMVLKALFTGITLNRIIGLDARLTPELTRMAKDYASERRTAGRSVPSDIVRLIT